MDDGEGWMRQMNGLVSEESTSGICTISAERWMEAEERTAELIDCIQPNQPSEVRRMAVADYVQRLIRKCFHCQMITFGSVPLKTYLPDGDIDLTAFSNDPNLEDTWAALVRDILETEEKNEKAEFRVKEVQYIQAEVKIIKCLVENIVVDISFNQLGGLSTLFFLGEVAHLINNSNLFKRSIILIKAWCYYESRILGAHHGLISTYALETLVLYIFHVLNKPFSGPLEVLYRFLEFFSNFDWDSFCVSLRGPVPVSSLPDVTPVPPRKDNRELLLTKGFMQKCTAAYAVYPSGPENQGQPFISKHLNIIDPLRVNNNLGRSVSKGNFFRIRSAFSFGAKRLARLLNSPYEDIAFVLSQFFLNTLERHGSGNRPDAPNCDLHYLMRSDGNLNRRLRNQYSTSMEKKTNESLSANESVDEGHGSANQKGSRMSDLYDQEISNQSGRANGSQRGFKLENNMNDYIQGKYLFARTRSSPELTDAYTCISSQAGQNKAVESVKKLVASANTGDTRRNNGGPECMSPQSTASSADDPPARQISPQLKNDIAIDLYSSSNNYFGDSGLSNLNEECSSVLGAQGMIQEEQDFVNMMSSSVGNFGGQIPMPLNFPPAHLPPPFSPSMLASIGFAQRNLAELVPGNISSVDPMWGSNLQFAQGSFPSTLAHYVPGLGLSSNSRDLNGQINKNYESAEVAAEDVDKDVWHERHGESNGRLGPDDQNLERRHTDDKQPSTSGSHGLVQSSRLGGSGSSLRHQQKNTEEKRRSMRDETHDTLHSDDQAGSARLSSSQASSMTTREKKGRKTVSATPPSPYGEGETVSTHSCVEADDDGGDLKTAALATETAEIYSVSQPSAAFHSTRMLSGFEATQTSGSDSSVSTSPMPLNHGTHQRETSGSGSVPFTFYPTGPPVPFVTMIPVYNVPSDARSDAASSQNFDSSDRFGDSEAVSASSSTGRAPRDEPSEVSIDILNSDFLSHWQNLQFGRYYQNPQLVYPSPVVLPPDYLQGHVPLDGNGRPHGTILNTFSQFAGYGPRLVPISSTQSVSGRPAVAYQQYVDEMPRYRTGTGTFLPNPKPPTRDRHSSGPRRSYYNHGKGDYHGGGWNTMPKSRANGRVHSRNQADKFSSRQDKLSSNENWAERPWNSHRHESSYPSQNGAFRPNSQNNSASLPYGMHPLSGANHNELGSFSPVDFMGPNEVSQLMDGARTRGTVEDQRFYANSQMSSPDQPSSPHLRRRV